MESRSDRGGSASGGARHSRRDGRGPYAIQAAIAAVHAEAASAAETDWNEIVGLYDILMRMAPSPIVELNRAVAIAMRDGPAAGLPIIDGLLARGELRDYRLAHAARGGIVPASRTHRRTRTRSFERALALTRQGPERRLLERRLAERVEIAAPRSTIWWK